MHHFFALVDRLRTIRRWGLMANLTPENVAEHSHTTAIFAHALAVIGRERFGKDVDPGAAAAAALFHDAPEIYTGDLPTPVKYFDADTRAALAKAEEHAAQKLLSALPNDLHAVYAPLVSPHEGNAQVAAYVKAADKLSALVKCLAELRGGNGEFKQAADRTRAALTQMDLPELDVFMAEFLPSFALSLDELNG